MIKTLICILGRKMWIKCHFSSDFSRFDLEMTLTFEWPHLYIILKCYISIVVIWLINISFYFVEKVMIRLVIFIVIAIYGGHLGRHLGFLSYASVAKWLYSIFINTEPYPTTWYQNKKYSRGVPKKSLFLSFGGLGSPTTLWTARFFTAWECKFIPICRGTRLFCRFQS